MKKRNKALLVLLALVLVTGLGAKMYSNITMGDNEWIGLGASAGRIAFDDQTIDEVIVKDARLGVGTGAPTAQVEIWHNVAGNSANPHLKLDYNNYNFASFYMSGMWDLVIETTYSNSDIRMITPVNRDITFLPGAGGNVGINTDTPYYALDVSGELHTTEHIYTEGWVYADTTYLTLDVIAGDDVVAGDDVWANDDVIAVGDVTAGDYVNAENAVRVGDAASLAAAGSMPFAAAVPESGGYFFYTADVSADTDLTGIYSEATQIRRQAWVRWLVFDVSAQSTHYGEAVLELWDVVVIADEGANDLELECTRAAPPNTEEYLRLDVVGNHTYEVVLMAMWQ